MCTKTHPAHPEYGTCVSNVENHAFCQFFGPTGEAEIWTNEDYVDIRQKPKAERSQDLRDMKVSVRDKRREDKQAARAAREIGDDGLSFDGETYEEAFDQERLGKQAKRVFTLMADGERRTLGEIAAVTNDPEASISARLRDFRKPRFGSHVVNRYRRGDPSLGLFEFELIVQSPEAQPTPRNID